MLIAFAILTCGLISQNVSSQNLNRKVLFTMGANEEIDFGEYSVAMNSSGDKFAAILRDELTEKFTFVFNGQRVISDMDDYSSLNSGEILYVDPSVDNGYCIRYSKNEEVFLNIKGEVKGPFENAYLISEDEYKYELAGLWYVNTNGVVTGPYKSWFPENKTPSGKYAFFFYQDDQYYANISGKIIGPYSYYDNIVILDNGDYAFCYGNENDESFVRVNEKLLGPYKSSYNALIAPKGNYGFTYSLDNNSEYVNVNGKIMGPYNSCYLTGISGNGDYAFIYQDDEYNSFVRLNTVNLGPYNSCSSVIMNQSGKYIYSYDELTGQSYVNVNGVSMGPYLYYGEAVMTESGKYAFSYAEDNDNYFVNVNGKKYGPFGWVDKIELNEDGTFTLFYNDSDGLSFKNINGESSLVKCFQYNYTGYYEMSSTDKLHNFISTFDYPYVVIDGVQYGNASALFAQYDKVKNCFIWNTLEDKQIVTYEYKLK